MEPFHAHPSCQIGLLSTNGCVYVCIQIGRPPSLTPWKVREIDQSLYSQGQETVSPIKIHKHTFCD